MGQLPGGNRRVIARLKILKHSSGNSFAREFVREMSKMSEANFADENFEKETGEEPFTEGASPAAGGESGPGEAIGGRARAFLPSSVAMAFSGGGGAGWGGWARGAPPGATDNGGRVIALVDMNAFFAQVEQRCNPQLIGKPVLVGGNPTTRTIVTAASYEAKARGVKTAMSYFEAMRLCPDAVIVEGNQDKYLSYCRRLAGIFREFTDLVEVFSIDEAFLDLTPVLRLWGGGPEEIGRAIKRRVREELGLTCSVGIGPNKLVAKMAADWQKPDGLVIVRPEELPEILWPHAVEEIVGVGSRMKKHLNALGITTIGRLARYNVEILKRRFGVGGEWLHQRANGIDPSPVDPDASVPVRSMGHSYTLPHNTEDPETIRWFIFWLADKVARRLRRENYRARTVTLVVRSPDMFTFGRALTLPEPVCSGHELADAAMELFHRHVPERAQVRLLGVSASGLVPADHYQLSLQSDMVRTEALLHAVDRIKDKFGDDALTFATLMRPQRALIMPKVGFFLTTKEKEKAGI